MAFNKNRVLAVNKGRTEVNPAARQPIAVDHDMDEWFMPVWAGVDPANGNPLWEKVLTDADGKEYKTYTNSYNAATRQFIGKSAAPKFTGRLHQLIFLQRHLPERVHEFRVWQLCVQR